jgi:hypothetical protein
MACGGCRSAAWATVPLSHQQSLASIRGGMGIASYSLLHTSIASRYKNPIPRKEVYFGSGACHWRSSLFCTLTVSPRLSMAVIALFHLKSWPFCYDGAKYLLGISLAY